MGVVKQLVFVLISTCISDLVSCNFCSENIQTFVTEEANLVKESPDIIEYGIDKHSKSLHCCATNFKSILWFKGDKLFPWRDRESNFILDSRSRNQTLYIKELSTDDGGSYTCHIIGDSFFHTMHIKLNVFEIGFSGKPEKTSEPPARVPVDLNETVKLYCETFVGKINLPDAKSKINWFKVGVNNTKILLSNDTRTSVRKVIRDEGQTIGLYLVIENIELSDYGQYICSVSNTDDQFTEMQSELVHCDHFFSLSHGYFRLIMLYVTCGLMVAVLVTYLLYFKFRYNIQLRVRRYTTTEKNESNKEYDVFILYEAKEVNFVTGVLIPTLTNEHDYNVCSHVLESGSAMNMECQARIAVSKSVLVVMTASEMNNPQSQKFFAQKLYSVSNFQTKVICLLIQDKRDNLSPQSTQLISSMKHLTFLLWPMYKEDWQKLRQRLKLHLPIKSARKSTTTNYLTVNDKHIVCNV